MTKSEELYFVCSNEDCLGDNFEIRMDGAGWITRLVCRDCGANYLPKVRADYGKVEFVAEDND